MTTLMTTLRCPSGFVWFRCEGYTRNLRSDSVGKHGRGVLRRGLLEALAHHVVPMTPIHGVQHAQELLHFGLKHLVPLRAPALGPTACTSGSSRPCVWRQRICSRLVSNCDAERLGILAWDRLQTSTTLVCFPTRVIS